MLHPFRQGSDSQNPQRANVLGMLRGGAGTLRRLGIAALILVFGFWILPWHSLAQTAHNITVSWTYTQGSDIATGFNVYRGTVSGGPYSKLTATPLSIATLTYADTSGTGGTTYYYVVTAVDATGSESANSAQASAVFLGNPAIPAGVTAVAH